MYAWLIDSLLCAQAADGWWATTLSELDPHKRFSLLIVAIGCATGVIYTALVFLSGTINSIHRRRVDAEMKRDMIERGLSADEIAKIIETISPPEDATERWIASCSKPKKSS